MDMKKFKEIAEKGEEDKKEILSLKVEAKQKFKDFFQVMSESDNIYREKKEKFVNQFIEDFIKTMEKEGLSIKKEFDIGIVSAEYNDRIIEIRDINYERDKFYLCIDGECNTEFWVTLPPTSPDYEVWKDNIVICGKELSDFSNNLFDAYENFVDYFQTKEEIKEIIKKVQINIDHFSESIKDADKCDYCIQKWGTEEIYKNFNGFFESIKE